MIDPTKEEILHIPNDDFMEILDDYHVGRLDALGLLRGSFVRSNGTMVARIYERLTKRSRRRTSSEVVCCVQEASYREGVKDALEALRDELSFFALTERGNDDRPN